MSDDLQAYNSVPNSIMEDSPIDMELDDILTMLSPIPEDTDPDSELFLAIRVYQKELKGLSHRLRMRHVELLAGCDLNWSIFVAKLLSEFPPMYAKKHLHDFIEYVDECSTKKTNMHEATRATLIAMARTV